MNPVPRIWKDRVRRLLPPSVRRRVVRMLARPRVGSLDFGDLRRTEPVSRLWGANRGTPIDRIFIEAFLGDHRAAVTGDVLEFGNRNYSTRFRNGRPGATDIFDVDPGNPNATLVGDLASPEGLPEEAFDCILCIQTLQFVRDLPTAFGALHAMLKPGGTLLLTVPGIAQIVQGARNPWEDYWRLTPSAVRLLASSAFPPERVRSVACFGNVLTATAFLQGIAAEELDPDELQQHDPAYPVIVALAARRDGGPA
jgi:SAM-dependent methyltransferase